MGRRSFLIATALTEAGAAVLLLTGPAMFVRWLLGGDPMEAPDALLIARFAGVALLAIGVACWCSQNDGVAANGLLAGVLAYDAAAAGLLLYAAVVLHRTGPVLWPVVALHGALALWCIGVLQSNEHDAGATARANGKSNESLSMETHE